LLFLLVFVLSSKALQQLLEKATAAFGFLNRALLDE